MMMVTTYLKAKKTSATSRNPRELPSEGKGRVFESRRARQENQQLSLIMTSWPAALASI
jgi:hypothetical protein